MFLHANKLVQAVKDGRVQPTKPSLRYPLTYILLLVLQIIGVITLMLELCVLIISYFEFRSKGLKDSFWKRYTLVSAGPLLRMTLGLLAVAIGFQVTRYEPIYLCMLPIMMWYVVRRIWTFSSMLKAEGSAQHTSTQAQDVVPDAVARVQADLEIENIVQEDVLRDLGLWDKLQQVQALHSTGVYSDQELSIRRKELFLEVDWRDMDLTPEELLLSLDARRKNDLVQEEEIAWVKSLVF